MPEGVIGTSSIRTRRKSIMRRCSAWLLAIAFAGPVVGRLAPALESAESGARAAASLDDKLAASVARGDVPGLVAIAATRNRVLYRGAFGLADAARERRMTMDTMFRIASMTKPITSVAAMQLYEQGRFALDDPAEKYLPELSDPMVFESFDVAARAYRVRAARTKITVRHLFTHTSGLAYGFTSATVRDFKPREGEHYEAPTTLSAAAKASCPPRVITRVSNK